MVRLREIARTSAFAWSPGSGKPLLVTGTLAGTVDADFSDETKLELWDLDLDNEAQGLELEPIGSIVTDSRLVFYDIAWGPSSAEHPKGIIAGALENGSLDLWDAAKLATASSNPFMSRTTKHTGKIKSLQFNPLKPQILATAGDKGELFIYDINDISNPFRLGTPTARPDDLECVAWNRKVPHILATGGKGGFVTVWDLKTKKASLTLNNSRREVSAIVWDPNYSTKLLTASPDEKMPVIFLWDLRNSNAPERTLQGHDIGVLSLSWCEQDSDILISCGKDNRTIVWNPQSGEPCGEFPEMTNWTFMTRFNPCNPNLSATASLDGKITIQTLQNTNPTVTQASAHNSLDGEDFFTKAQTQPQSASFSLKHAPKWLGRPAGATFGFGGKLAIFKQAITAQRLSTIEIRKFAVDSDVGTVAEKFDATVSSGDIKNICESHLEGAASAEEKADWQVMQSLMDENPRQQIVKSLDFADGELTNGSAEVPAETQDDKIPTQQEKDLSKKSRLSNLFTDSGDADDFLSNLSATKGIKTEGPFHLLGDDDSASDKKITRALMLGNFGEATDICLSEDRIADAFMIANCASRDLVDKVQSAYLSRKNGSPSYLRLLGSVIAKDLWDVVHNADLSNWKETMATLCTFASPAEFPDLCATLGDRVLESGSRQDATFCYLVGSKLNKVASIWISQLSEAEQADVDKAGANSTFSIHAKQLQHLIEKVTVFRQVTKFVDPDMAASSGWALAALYDKYIEYADIVAAHGQLSVAKKYLDLLPDKYPAAALAKSRVNLALRKPTALPSARQPVSSARTSSRAQPVQYQPPQPTSASPANPYGGSVQSSQGQYAPLSTNVYAPPAQITNPYGPPAQTAGPYPQGYQPPQPTGGYGSYGPPQSFGGPPQGSASPTPPPPRVKDAGSWNDVPVVSKKPPVRKSTPSAAPITTPFPNQTNLSMPPSMSPYGPPSTGASPPPPPPKGPAPPRVISPLAGPPQTGGAFPAPPRPLSAASPYAPPPPPHPSQSAPGGPGGLPMPHSPMAPQLGQRVGSPYNAPPSAMPPTNRYAPTPSQAAQATSQYGPTASQVPHMAGPPPMGGGGPRQVIPGPPPMAGGAAAPPPPPPPPPMGHGPAPAAPLSSSSKPPVAGPPKASAEKATKYPPGDRSHIPANAQQLVELLSRDMQRVAAQAPAAFAPQVKDTQKRLDLLFDHLNNAELVRPDTVEQLSRAAEALQDRNYAEAQRIQLEIQTQKTDECGKWMVGLKKLISMSKVTP